MLYFILRPLTRIALKVYFRRITVNGLSNLPKDQPVLLCSNHPTGFIEPCLLACFLPRTLHFLVRGDLFEKPVLKRILISTNQIPIYRFKDGYKKLRNNRDVMNISYNKLANGGAILIFPEASTKQVRYLRPIRKGAAQMALKTLELHPSKQIHIIPIGINYSNPNTWRSYVNINIGQAIIPDLPEDESSFRQEALKLTATIETAMSSLLLDKNEGITEEDLDRLNVLGQWEKPVPTAITVKHDDESKFAHEKALSAALKEEDDIPGSVDQTYSTITPGTTNAWWEFILALILIIPVTLILALNSLPIFFGMFMRNKYVREKEFYASVAIAASLGAYMILFPVVFIILLVLYGWLSLLLFLLPLLGLLSLAGMDFILKVYKRQKLNAKLGNENAKQLYTEAKQFLNFILKRPLN